VRQRRLRFTIPGDPLPKQRARSYNPRTKSGDLIFKNGKPIIDTKTPDKTKAYEQYVSLIARQAAAQSGLRQPVPLRTPITLGCIFYLPIPSSWSQKKKNRARSGELEHTSRPDLSNLLKSIEDGAEGVLWKNDSQINVYGTVDGEPPKKLYSDEPRVEIEMVWFEPD